MLTAKTDTVDVVLGLESGADDYVMKPFKPKELTARIRARLRRADVGAAERLRVADVEIDVPGHQVTRDGEPISLTPLEFDLLVALARKPRQVFTREVLLEQVWGYRHAADTRLVNVHVQRLRSQDREGPGAPRGGRHGPRRRVPGRHVVTDAPAPACSRRATADARPARDPLRPRPATHSRRRVRRLLAEVRRPGSRSGAARCWSGWSC